MVNDGVKYKKFSRFMEYLIVPSFSSIEVFLYWISLPFALKKLKNWKWNYIPQMVV